MDADALAASFPPKIELPQEIRALCAWVATNGYPISGYFELRAHEDETLRCWFGNEKAIGQLAQFGAGADGSLYCVWRRPDGSTPIVHLGSEGDALLVLAPTALEFLRLLAIGYGELGYAELDKPATEEEEAAEQIHPKFQQWVRDTFGVSVPETGVEIVAPGSAAHAIFAAWVDERCG